MNRWDCDHPGCKTSAVGTGAAYGLRAIGWWFEPGEVGEGFLIVRESRLLCPAHRPDPSPCTDTPENAGKSCSMCTADREADRLQAFMGDDAAAYLQQRAESAAGAKVAST